MGEHVGFLQNIFYLIYTAFSQMKAGIVDETMQDGCLRFRAVRA